MTLSINVPEDMMSRMQASWVNLSRRALEALVVEAYRDEVLSAAEVGRLLGHSSRWEIKDSRSKPKRFYMRGLPPLH